MADAIKRTVVTRRHEYALRSPAPFVEVNKAIDWALSDMPEQRRRWDDAVLVEARDEELIVYWEEKADD